MSLVSYSEKDLKTFQEAVKHLKKKVDRSAMVERIHIQDGPLDEFAFFLENLQYKIQFHLDEMFSES